MKGSYSRDTPRSRLRRFWPRAGEPILWNVDGHLLISVFGDTLTVAESSGSRRLGAAIGLERQWRQRLAGLRTNTPVALGPGCMYFDRQSLFSVFERRQHPKPILRPARQQDLVVGVE